MHWIDISNHTITIFSLSSTIMMIFFEIAKEREKNFYRIKNKKTYERYNSLVRFTCAIPSLSLVFSLLKYRCKCIFTVEISAEETNRNKKYKIYMHNDKQLNI